MSRSFITKLVLFDAKIPRLKVSTGSKQMYKWNLGDEWRIYGDQYALLE
ncbi:MAG: hypothetical protein ACW972_09880 [Promethearchaeota archaeon]